MKTVRLASLVTVILVILHGSPAEAIHMTFAPGDLFVSFEKGPVQWRNPDGTLNAALVSVVQGSTSEGKKPSCRRPLCRIGKPTSPRCRQRLIVFVDTFNLLLI